MMHQGRILVFGKYGLPIHNILIPDRDEGKHRKTSSISIKPGTDEGYLVASGIGGAWVFTFKALAEAYQPFSHK
jgi:lactonase